MKYPAPIPDNATLAVISPASTPKPDRLKSGLKYLEDRGYSLRLGKHLQNQNKYLKQNSLI